MRIIRIKTVLCLLMAVASLHVQAANDKPYVIPELKTWNGGEGTYTLPAEITVYDATQKGKCGKVAQLFLNDFADMFGTKGSVVNSRKGAKPVVTLQLKADKKLGIEGYQLTINKDGITLTAPTEKGLYWGTRTILQMLDHNGGKALECGVTRDWPDYPVRGAMLDAGRKYLPMSMLRDYVKIMAYYKMNMLQVHLNDNGFPLYFGDNWDKTQAAFRLESDRFPGLTARDGHYTKKEFTGTAAAR
jgi:hexosaminidase